MSAYVVDDETINRILAWLRTTEGGPKYSHVPYQLKTAGFDLANPDSVCGLGVEMHRLNIYAVDARYGDGTCAGDGVGAFDFNDHYPAPSIFQALKSLRCLLYQCSEGDVPDRQLFKLLDAVSAEMALSIVSEMPQYEMASWA